MTSQTALHARPASAPVERDPRWARILARDETADGEFWYSVATTGVYCRPACPSRGCNPKNVAIHDSLAEARATGFRPCRRCRPEDPPASARRDRLVADACRRIEAAPEPPSLEALAASAGLSPSHFHRMFKAVAGVTPKAYAEACRAGRVREALSEGRPVAEAIYEAGFGSSGRFYARSNERLGMTPTRFRAGGVQEELRFAVGRCSLGEVLVASSSKGVAAILIGEDADALARDLQDRFPRARLIGADPGYEALVARVVGLIEAPAQGAGLPLDVRGTVFQQRVWQALSRIPPGRTVSYAELARRIGLPKASRAVAGACAANPLAVAVPCHRVVRKDGDLSGYRWGVERKAALLAREAAG